MLKGGFCMKKLMIPLVMVVCLSGCASEKTLGVSVLKQTSTLSEQANQQTNENETENEILYGEVFEIGDEEFRDWRPVIAELWDISLEELEAYGVHTIFYENVNRDENTKPYYEFEKDFRVAEAYGRFSMNDYEYGMASCYSMIRYGDSPSNPMKLRQRMPLESLDTCSKEEVLRDAMPYIEKLGYADSEISVYAMTLDYLQEKAEEMSVGAPDEKYQGLSYQEMKEKREANPAKENKMYSLQKLKSERESISEKGIPWEKKHEALYIVCRPYLDGKTIYCWNQYLELIYVPYFDKIVFLRVSPSFAIESLGEEPLISQKDAIAEVKRLKHIKEDDAFVVETVELVYSYFRKFIKEEDRHKDTFAPFWQVNYTCENGTIQDTVRINAITGSQSQL